MVTSQHQKQSASTAPIAGFLFRLEVMISNTPRTMDVTMPTIPAVKWPKNCDTSGALGGKYRFDSADIKKQTMVTAMNEVTPPAETNTIPTSRFHCWNRVTASPISNEISAGTAKVPITTSFIHAGGGVAVLIAGMLTNASPVTM